MYYLNATQAALEIGISYRTMRRRIEAGQIEATRGEDGQYALAVSEVERLKRAQSERPRPAMSGHSEAGQERSDLELRIADLERRVRTLEAMMSHDRKLSDSPQPQQSLYQQRNDREDARAQPQPQIRTTEPKSAIPPDAIHSTDFAKQLGVSKTVMEGWLKNGVRGEQLERERVPVAPGKYQNWFTEAQRQKAIEILRRHNKI